MRKYLFTLLFGCGFAFHYQPTAEFLQLKVDQERPFKSIEESINNLTYKPIAPSEEQKIKGSELLHKTCDLTEKYNLNDYNLDVDSKELTNNDKRHIFLSVVEKLCVDEEELKSLDQVMQKDKIFSEAFIPVLEYVLKKEKIASKLNSI